MVSAAPMSACTILAARPGLDPRAVWAAVGLVAFILLGILVLWWVNRWRKDEAEIQPLAGDQLTEFRELHERGQISQEEFERIRRLLGQRLRQELDVPDAKTEPPPPPHGPNPS
jgi:hypothetical protein